MGAVSVTGHKICIVCGEPLPLGYRDPHHRECAETEPDELDAQLEAAERAFGRPNAKSTHRIVEGTKLTPVDALPVRQKSGWAESAIRAFLAGGEPVCMIERPGVGCYGIRNALRSAILAKRLHYKVAAVNRQKACYLVKVQEGGEPVHKPAREKK